MNSIHNERYRGTAETALAYGTKIPHGTVVRMVSHPRHKPLGDHVRAELSALLFDAMLYGLAIDPGVGRKLAEASTREGRPACVFGVTKWDVLEVPMRERRE